MPEAEVDALVSEWLKSEPSVRLEQIRTEIQKAPHRASPLPKGWQGVYMFRYSSVWLKVGKAGPNSNARWQSQHYSPRAAVSNLAYSLLRYARPAEVEDPRLPASLKVQLERVGPDEIGDWIKQHTARCNLLLDARVDQSVLAHLENLAIAALRPVFEGRWAFGGQAL